MTAIRRQYSVKLSPGTLYPLLYVLEENGYLKGEWKAHKKKKKRTYMITEDGKKFVRENIQALEKILNTIEKGSKNLPSK
jgi:DNA-binding PadR family transcriptional regulator